MKTACLTTSEPVIAAQQQGINAVVRASQQSRRITLPNSLPYDVLLTVMKYYFSLTIISEWQEHYSAVLEEDWHQLIRDLQKDVALNEEYLRYYIAQLTPVALWQELLRLPPALTQENDSNEMAPVVVIDEEQFYSQSYTRFSQRLRGGPPIPNMTIDQLVQWYQGVMKDREAAMERMLYEGVRGFLRRCLINQELIIAQAQTALENIIEHLGQRLSSENLRQQLEFFLKEAKKIRNQGCYRSVLDLLRSLDPHRNPQSQGKKTYSLSTHQEAQALQKCFQFLHQLEQSSGLLAELFIFYNLFQVYDIIIDLKVLTDRTNQTKLPLSRCFYLNYIQYVSESDYYTDKVLYETILSNPELVAYLTTDNKDLLVEWISRLTHLDETLPRVLESNPALLKRMTLDLWIQACQKSILLAGIIYKQPSILSGFSSQDRYRFMSYNARHAEYFYNRKQYGYRLKRQVLSRPLQKKTLYLNVTDQAIQYEVVGIDGQLKQGDIPRSKLLDYFPRIVKEIQSHPQHYAALLDYTTRAGHTQTEAQQFLREMESRDLIHFIAKEYRHGRNDFSSFIREELRRRSPAFFKLMSWLDVSYEHTIASFYCSTQNFNCFSSQERYDLLVATWDDFCIHYNNKSWVAEYFLLGMGTDDLKKIQNNPELSKGAVQCFINSLLRTHCHSEPSDSNSITEFDTSNRVPFSKKENKDLDYSSSEFSSPSVSPKPIPALPPQGKDPSSRWTPKQKWAAVGMTASLIVGGVFVASGIGLIAGGGIAAALGLIGFVKLLVAYKTLKLMIELLSVIVGTIGVGGGLVGGYALYQSRKKSKSRGVTLFDSNNHYHYQALKEKEEESFNDEFSSLGLNDSVP